MTDPNIVDEISDLMADIGVLGDAGDWYADSPGDVEAIVESHDKLVRVLQLLLASGHIQPDKAREASALADLLP